MLTIIFHLLLDFILFNGLLHCRLFLVDISLLTVYPAHLSSSSLHLVLYLTPSHLALFSFHTNLHSIISPLFQVTPFTFLFACIPHPCWYPVSHCFRHHFLHGIYLLIPPRHFHYTFCSPLLLCISLSFIIPPFFCFISCIFVLQPTCVSCILVASYIFFTYVSFHLNIFMPPFCRSTSPFLLPFCLAPHPSRSSHRSLFHLTSVFSSSLSLALHLSFKYSQCLIIWCHFSILHSIALACIARAHRGATARGRQGPSPARDKALCRPACNGSRARSGLALRLVAALPPRL